MKLETQKLTMMSVFFQKYTMALILLIAALSGLVTVSHCGNYTVTDEAWFDVTVKDMDGPGEDFTGRFVVALFGDTAPMTTMNFVHITKGYKRGTVSVYI